MIEDIIRITYAESTLPLSWIFHGGDKQKTVPIIFSFFLVIADDRKILVDTGCETMPDFDMHNHIAPTAALKARGYAPEDITDVIITHAHHDHIACVGCFPNAAVHIQRQEMERGKGYLAANRDVRPFDDVCALTEELVVRRIGGHTAGSCVVECHKDGTVYVLCGDECYSSYNLSQKVPTATSAHPENSTAFVEKYASDEYICLLCHEA